MESRRHPPSLLWAELALAGTTTVLATTMVRLFDSSRFLGRLLLVVAIGHLASALLRRARVPVTVALPVLAAFGLVVVSWIYLGTTLSWGLPTGETLEATRLALSNAFSPFEELVAPVPITLGFELVLAVGMWSLVTFADAAAFSGVAPVQAVIPLGATFVGSAIFARGRHDALAAAAMIGTVLVFLAAHRAWRESQRAWVGDQAPRGSLAILRGGVAIAALATLIGAVSAPQAPGAGQEGLVDLRSIGRNPGPIEVANPLVGVANLLGPRSNELAFVARTSGVHYWRLTALDLWVPETQQWKTQRTYREVRGGTPLPGVEGTESASAEIEVAELPGIWLPAPFRVRQVDTRSDLRFDAETSSVIVAGRSTVPAMTYRVSSTGPAPTEPPGPSGLEATGISAATRVLAASVTQDATTDLERALALQNWFRTEFTYDLAVDYSGTADPTAEFLRERRGFCQQFASTFAILARTLGIPSRVAVGFTPGVAVAGPDEEGRITYEVRGRQAHAWPEVYLAETGWVAFEPTPGRGNPDAEQLTGVPLQQDVPEDAGAEPATPTTAVGAQGTPSSVPDSGQVESRDPDAGDGPTADEATPAPRDARWVAVAAGLILGAAALGLFGRICFVALARRRRRGRRDSPARRVRAAWIESCDWLELAALEPHPEETPAEFAARVSRALDLPEIETLAGIETARIYSSGITEPDDAETAESIAQRTRAVAIAHTDSRSRAAHLVGWHHRNETPIGPAQSSSSRRNRSRARSEALLK